MELWTFAFQHTVDQWNSSPKKEIQYRTPDEVFFGMTTRQNSKNITFQYFHPLGCPVYILDKSLANGASIPEWKPRSRVGIYLGYLRDHARNVAWVLNPNTDHISTQYHNIFDDMFTTVATTSDTDKIET
eukprot:6812397-Ditylum_brightwellii.AAC.1